MVNVTALPNFPNLQMEKIRKKKFSCYVKMFCNVNVYKSSNILFISRYQLILNPLFSAWSQIFMLELGANAVLSIICS